MYLSWFIENFKFLYSWLRHSYRNFPVPKFPNDIIGPFTILQSPKNRNISKTLKKCSLLSKKLKSFWDFTISFISMIVQRVALLKMMQHQQELEQQNCNLNCVHCRITGIFFFVTFTIFSFFLAEKRVNQKVIHLTQLHNF